MMRKKDWTVPIPGTCGPERMRENADASGIEATAEEIKALDDALNKMNLADTMARRISCYRKLPFDEIKQFGNGVWLTGSIRIFAGFRLPYAGRIVQKGVSAASCSGYPFIFMER